MRTFITLFLIIFFSTNLNASEKLKLLSNAPQELEDSGVFKEIDFEKATKYESFHIPFKANPNLTTLQY